MSCANHDRVTKIKKARKRDLGTIATTDTFIIYLFIIYYAVAIFCHVKGPRRNLIYSGNIENLYNCLALRLLMENYTYVISH